MLAKYSNGDVVVGLPTSEILRDGRTVSNYNLLPNKDLIVEGWLPYEEVKPTYDENTQILQHDKFEILSDKIIEYFIAVEKPQDVYDYMLNELGV